MAAFVAQTNGSGSAQMLQIAAAVNKALRGETANVGTVTAAAGSAKVTVQDPRCRYGRLALLIPLDAEAAAAAWHLSDMTQGSMEFTFGAALGADATFGWALIGDGNQ